jgi:hypothetical protein
VPKKTARIGAITDLLKKNKDCGLHTTHLERLSVLAASSGTLAILAADYLCCLLAVDWLPHNDIETFSKAKARIRRQTIKSTHAAW